MKDLKEPIVSWSGKGREYLQEEIDVVVKAMKDADPLTQGRYQNEFEAKSREFFGVPHAFAVSSCTAALELAAILTRVGPSDEVIIPAHTFAATAIPFCRTGAKVVWADIDLDTRVVTAETIAKCITPRTKIIVVVHLYGLVADMDPIMALAKSRGLFVVEDAAQAPGGRYKGKRVGSIGDFGCFSFHTHKNISTLGEGGLLTLKDDKLASLVSGLRHNGMCAWDIERDRYWNPAMGRVDFDIDGFWPYNFCIGEVQCALGIKQLDLLDGINATRRERGLAVIRELKEFPELHFQSIPEGCEHTFHLLAARFDGKSIGRTRDEFMELMAFKHKVKVIVQYYPLYRYPMFRKAGLGEANCPNTDRFFDNMVSFPFHQWLPDDKLAYMVNAAKESILELRKK